MNIVDYPMSCCGMVMAEKIQVHSAIAGALREDGTKFPTTEEQYDIIFNAIERHQRVLSRNCAMITLSSEQTDEIAAAKQRGWKVIFEYYNPNSENMNYVCAKVIWEDEQQYVKDKMPEHRRKVNWQWKIQDYEVSLLNTNVEKDPLEGVYRAVKKETEASS